MLRNLTGLALVWIFFLQNCAAEQILRTWVDSTGKHSFVGKFLNEEKGFIYIKNELGEEVKIAFSLFSDNDKNYIRERRKAKLDASRSTKTPNVSTLGVKLVSTDFSQTQEIAPEKSANLVAASPKISAAKKAPLQPFEITIPPVSEFESFNTVAPSHSFLLSRNQSHLVFSHSVKSQTIVNVVEFNDESAIKSSIIEGAWTVHDVSADGQHLLLISGFRYVPGNTLAIYFVGGDDAQELARWQINGLAEEPVDIHWAKWVGDPQNPNQMVAFTETGELLLWDFPEIKPAKIFRPHTEIISDLLATISTDGRFVACQNGRNISLMDLLGQQVCSEFVVHRSFDAMAISDDRRYLAGIENKTLSVWNIETASLEKEILNIKAEQNKNLLHWLGPSHMMVGQGGIIDLENQVPVWKYTGGMSLLTADGLGLFLYRRTENDRLSRKVVTENRVVGYPVLAKITPSQIQTAAKVRTQLTGLIFTEGREVRIDYSAVPAGYVDKLKAKVGQIVKDRKLVESDRTPLVLKYYFKENPIQKRYTMQPGTPGFRPGQPSVDVSFTERWISVAISYEGKSIRTVSHGSSPPNYIQVREGESVEQHVISQQQSFDQILERLDLSGSLSFPIAFQEDYPGQTPVENLSVSNPSSQ